MKSSVPAIIEPTGQPNPYRKKKDLFRYHCEYMLK